MMKPLDCFMDIERFVEWTYKNHGLFVDLKDDGAVWPPTESAGRKYKSYSSLPTKIIDEVNKNHLNGFKKFEFISIADLILCVNMAKDHNRGKSNVESKPITSTGKKVLMLFLLGGQVESDALTVSNKDSTEKELFKYLQKKCSDEGSVKTFNYIPGRTVSYTQLCKLSKRYANHITEIGIDGGLEDLIERNLIEECDKDNKLYKLSFEGCKKFLDANVKLIRIKDRVMFEL